MREDAKIIHNCKLNESFSASLGRCVHRCEPYSEWTISKDKKGECVPLEKHPRNAPADCLSFGMAFNYIKNACVSSKEKVDKIQWDDSDTRKYLS